MNLGALLLPDPRLMDLQDTILTDADGLLTVTVRITHPTSPCPVCTTCATRIHRRYTRTTTDLPWARYRCRFILHVRRFFCDQSTCARTIFTERLPTILAPWARRTRRLVHAHQQIGLALGGAAGVRLAHTLGFGGGVDLLLHAIRTAALPTPPAPQHIGVDDWAWRKGSTYGTIIVDHATQRPLDLLPDRRAETLAAWLQDHPSVTLITRDRRSASAEGATSGAPTAIQVADRFHLLVNIREAVFQSLPPYRTAIETLLTDSAKDTTTPDPDPVERSSWTGCPAITAATALPPQPIPVAKTAHTAAVQQRRHEQAQRIHDLHGHGWTQRAIAAHLRLDRQTVARYLRHPLGPPPQRHPARRSILDSYKPYVLERWNAGCFNASQLFRELIPRGYTGSDGAVRRYITQVRKATGLPAYSQNGTDHPAVVARKSCPSLTRIAWQIVQKPPSTEPEPIMLTHLRQNPALATLITLATTFTQMVRERNADALDAWLVQAKTSPFPAVQRLGRSLQDDMAAVSAALSMPQSNGRTEGHVHRLKLLKRQMYGRAKLDLLRQRLLAP